VSVSEFPAYELKAFPGDLVCANCVTDDDVVERDVDGDGVRDEAATDHGYEWPRCLRCGERIPDW